MKSNTDDWLILALSALLSNALPESPVFPGLSVVDDVLVTKGLSSAQAFLPDKEGACQGNKHFAVLRVRKGISLIQ